SGDARASCVLGRVLLQKARRRGESFAPAEEALVRARASGDDATRACAIDQLGLIRYYGKILKDQGSWGDSEQPFREALEMRWRIGDPRELAESLFHVGLVEQQSGRADAARGRFEEAYLRAKESGNQLILAECERHLGGDAEERQDFAAALAHYRPALE